MGEVVDYANIYGIMWWIADSTEELMEWRKQWGQDVRVIRTSLHRDGSDRIDVVFEIPRATASAILGYEVEETEYLEEWT